MKLFNYEAERKKAIDHDTRIHERYFYENGKEKTVYVIYVKGIRTMQVKEKEYFHCGEEALFVMAKAIADVWEARHQMNNK